MAIWGTSAHAGVVIPKNEKVHGHVNLNAGRKFPLQRLTLSALFPAWKGPFTVLCDECGEEYTYQPAEV